MSEVQICGIVCLCLIVLWIIVQLRGMHEQDQINLWTKCAAVKTIKESMLDIYIKHHNDEPMFRMKMDQLMNEVFASSLDKDMLESIWDFRNYLVQEVERIGGSKHNAET